MKTAYELAMDRLNKSSPAIKLTAEQKKQLAELEMECAAKIAGREITLKGAIDQAMNSGEAEKAAQLQRKR